MKKLLLIFLIGWPLPGQAQFSLAEPHPRQGEPVTIQLEEPASELVITYRPRSAVAKSDTLRADAPVMAFDWTPAEAGVVAVSTPAGSKNVSVRFRGWSVTGLIVMILAGVLLFSGAAFAFRLLFRDEAEDGTLDLDIEHRPDT